MHEAWTVEDIKYLILECLERQDLARLARTSRAFFSLATDLLWETLDSLEPLAYCLAPDFGDRPLRREDLRRLDFYTSKVRRIKLEIDQQRAPIRPPAEFSAVKKKNFTKRKRSKKSWKLLWAETAEVRPPSELFANLRSIRVSNVMEELLLPLVGISGLHLEKIYIKYIQDRQPESVIRRILDGFQDTPRLEYLFVRDGELGLVPRSLIQRAPLKHIRLDPRRHPGSHRPDGRGEVPIRYDVLQKSSLEHLTISLKNDWCTPEIEALEGKILPALKTLWFNLTDFAPDSRCNTCMRANTMTWACKSHADRSDRSITGSPGPPAARSPVAFLEKLDSPELELLNVKFPKDATGRMLLEVVAAAKRSCRLGNLTHLALAGGDGVDYFVQQGPKIAAEQLRAAAEMLLPLPRLKLLRMSVAPNFLDPLDLGRYRSIAAGLPALETLWLGHSRFAGYSVYGRRCNFERVRLADLAAFCQMLPKLVEVSVGAAIAEAPAPGARPDFACPAIAKLRIHQWVELGMHVPEEERLRTVQMYFPNSDYARDGPPKPTGWGSLF